MNCESSLACYRDNFLAAPLSLTPWGFCLILWLQTVAEALCTFAQDNLGTGWVYAMLPELKCSSIQSLPWVARGRHLRETGVGLSQSQRF